MHPPLPRSRFWDCGVPGEFPHRKVLHPAPAFRPGRNPAPHSASCLLRKTPLLPDCHPTPQAAPDRSGGGRTGTCGNQASLPLQTTGLTRSFRKDGNQSAAPDYTALRSALPFGKPRGRRFPAHRRPVSRSDSAHSDSASPENGQTALHCPP